MQGKRAVCVDIHDGLVLDIHAERVYDMIGKGASVSFEATKWVLESAPNLPPHLAMTLVALAWHADKEGRAAYPSQATLAGYTRKSERAVRKDLRELLELGLIRKGDGRAVEHLPADKRPTVYDVVTRLESGGNHSSARKQGSARKRGPARNDSSSTGGTTVPVAGGTTVPPKVVPTELQVEPPVEPPLPSPPAPEVLDAEIVDEEPNLPATVVTIPNAGQLTRLWIDHCAAHGVKLPKSTIGRYGKHIADAMKQGFDVNLIKRALAQMLADGEASRPSYFDNYLVRAQSGPSRGPRKLTPGEATVAKFAQDPEVAAGIADMLANYGPKASA